MEPMGLFNHGSGMRETKGTEGGSWELGAVWPAQKAAVSAQQVGKDVVVMEALEGHFRVELAGLGNQWVWKEPSVVS